MKIPKKGEEQKAEKINQEKNEVKPMEKEEHVARLGRAIGQNQPLFGEDDLIINTLELEKKEVGDQIDKARKTIENKEAEIDDLMMRSNNLRRSIAIIQERHVVEKPVKEAEPGDDKKKENEPEKEK